MARDTNLLCGLVRDENSMTEMFCNLMQFPEFRNKVLADVLSPEQLGNLEYESFNTQRGTDGHGQPDMIAENENLCLLFEMKRWKSTARTDNQPEGYLKYLLQHTSGTRCLLFVVPEGYEHKKPIEDCIKRISEGVGTDSGGMPEHAFIYWEDIIGMIQESGLADLNPFFGEFVEVLKGLYLPECIEFSKDEVALMFTSDIPSALQKLRKIVDGVAAKEGARVSKQKGSAYLSKRKDEYGIYFRDQKDREILWFGIWEEFWREKKKPLCFGVKNTFPEVAKKTFREEYGNGKAHGDWWMSWVTKDELADPEACITTIHEKLRSLCDAIEKQEERLSRFVEAEPEECMPIVDSAGTPTEESRPT